MSLPLAPTTQARFDRLGIALAEIEEVFVRGSGPGGQKINKTSSTVRVRHRRTGIEARCQDQRSQAANREQAWLDLCGKLEALARGLRASEEQQREKVRRQSRQKSRGQKVRMIQSKKHRARHKALRGRVGGDA